MYRPICIYTSICIHIKKSKYVNDVFFVTDTENTKSEKENMKTLPFDMYLVFTKILKGNLFWYKLSLRDILSS